MLPKWLTALFLLFQEAWSARRDEHTHGPGLETARQVEHAETR